MKLKVMTYNISSGHDYTTDPLGKVFQPAACAEVIRECAPDIVGLNEVDGDMSRSQKIKMAEWFGNRLNYYSFFAPALKMGDGLYGNALLSKYPILSAEIIPVPDPTDKSEPVYYETRDILHAVLSADGRAVDLFVTHFGLAREEQKNSVRTILGCLEKAKNPVILMGDFNVEKTSPILAPIFEKLNNTGDNLPDGSWSFPSGLHIREEREDGSSEHPYHRLIDYIFTSADFACGKVEIPERYASDHKPYLVELTF